MSTAGELKAIMLKKVMDTSGKSVSSNADILEYLDRANNKVARDIKAIERVIGFATLSDKTLYKLPSNVIQLNTLTHKDWGRLRYITYSEYDRLGGLSNSGHTFRRQFTIFNKTIKILGLNLGNSASSTTINTLTSTSTVVSATTVSGFESRGLLEINDGTEFIEYDSINTTDNTFNNIIRYDATQHVSGVSIKQCDLLASVFIKPKPFTDDNSESQIDEEFDDLVVAYASYLWLREQERDIQHSRDILLEYKDGIDEANRLRRIKQIQSSTTRLILPEQDFTIGVIV